MPDAARVDSPRARRDASSGAGCGAPAARATGPTRPTRSAANSPEGEARHAYAASPGPAQTDHAGHRMAAADHAGTHGAVLERAAGPEDRMDRRDRAGG